MTILRAQKPDGTFGEVQMDDGGHLLVTDTAEPVYPLLVIHDNDFGIDVDGFIAYNLLHIAQEKGLCKVIGAITNSQDYGGGSIAGALDAVRSYYNHDPVPIGIPEDAPADAGQIYMTQVADSCRRVAEVPTEESSALYRRLLEDAAPKSITIFGTGNLTALAAFMQSEVNGVTGIDLIEQKVARYVCGSGSFPTHNPLISTNFTSKPEAAHYVIDSWPVNVPVLFMGEDAAYNGQSPASPEGDTPAFGIHCGVLSKSTLHPLSYIEADPMLENLDVYRAYALAFGLDPTRWTLSPAGYLSIDEETGFETWTNDANGRQRYLVSNGSADDGLNMQMSKLLVNSPTPPMDAGCVAAWEFDGVVEEKIVAPVPDLSGNGHTLMPYGTSGPVYIGDHAVAFPDGYFETAANTDLGFNDTQPFTVIADVFVKDPTDVRDRLIITKSAGAGKAWTLGILSGYWRFGEGADPTEVCLASKSPLVAGWNRIICVQNYRLLDWGETTISERHIYVDGRMDDSDSSIPVTDASGSGPLRINGSPLQAGQEADYPVGMVRIYNRAFTAGDVALWTERPPQISRANVRRGIDRGDGITGYYGSEPLVAGS